MASQRTSSLLQIMVSLAYPHQNGFTSCYALVADCFDWGHTRSVYTRSLHCFDLLVSVQRICGRLFCSGHTSILYYTLIQFLIYRFSRSALVADYFTVDTLALSIIRSPTAHPYSRVHIFSVTNGLVRIRKHPRSRRYKVGAFFTC